MDCSILISTRNRANALARTLEAFRALKVPDGFEVEMIVVDNGSTDETPHVISCADLPTMEFRGLNAPLPGKSRALNSAIAQARGEVLLFTDDDVVPSPDWLGRMSAPLMHGCCDAVTGRILLAAELQRPWLTPMHTALLAERRQPAAANPVLVGASMGIRRHVFDRIPGFDTDLGPGMTGLGEDTLLWMQMVELGMCILPVADAEVIHYPDMSRFDHSGWADAARRLGRTNAYIWHHWKHLRIPKACIDEYWTRMKLHLRNLVQLRDKSMREGCSGWELSYRIRMESLKAFREMTDHPRKYPSPNERLRSMSCK